MAVDPTNWDMAAAIGQLVAAAAAVGGLVFVGLQLRASKRSVDVQLIQEFVRRVTEREEAFLNPADDRRKDQAFIEFLNFLEGNAAAFNAGLFPNVSRKIIRHSLINSISAIQVEPRWRERMLEAVKAPSTFDELRKFIETERKTISAVAGVFRTNLSP